MATPWDRWIWAAVVGAILSAAMVVFSNPAADTDLWGHLLFGLDKLEQWHVARVDSYSFTAHGLPWVNHEWLSEVIGAAVWRAAGDRGLLAGKILLGVLIGAWLVVECRRRGASALAVAVVGLTSVYGLWPGTMFRPQLFSYLMFAVLLSLLSRITDGRRRLAALLPVVMALWANLHGGFVVGLGALAIVSAWQLVRWLAGRDNFQESWPLLAASAGSTLAVLATPYGLELPRFLAATLSRGRPIGEWAPLPLLSGDFLEIKAVGAVSVAVIVVALVGRWAEVRGWEVALVMATILATVRHQRHAPFLLLAAAPFVAWGVTEAASRLAHRGWWRRAPRVPTRLATGVLVVAAVAQAVVAATAIVLTGGRIFVDPMAFPVAAIRFLDAQDAGGRLVLPFEWGEHALWHLSPEWKVSFDGRFETVYPEVVREAHYHAAIDPARWEDLADLWRADALLAPAVPAVVEIADRRPEDWKLVWRDPTAVVLVRSDGTMAGGFHESRPTTDERPLTAFP